MDTTTQQYWAAEESDSLAAALATRHNQWFNYMRSSLKLDLWNRCYRTHHLGALEYGRIYSGGVSGEQVLLKANHLRAINGHIVSGVTAERPSFDAKAINSDYESATQCILGQQILDYDVMRTKRLEAISRQAVEYAVVYGEGFILKTWNAFRGDIVGKKPGSEQLDEAGQPVPGTGKPLFSGTLEFRSVGPWDAVRDYTEDDPRKMQWYSIREFINKWDLIARYPDKEQDILSAPSRLESYTAHPIVAYNDALVAKAWTFTDEIECWHFFHARTDALPGGRYMLMAGNNWLSDGPLRYREVPVYRIAPANQPGTAFGYSANFDLQSLQHAVNAQVTTIATNQAAFGIQSVGVPKGSSLTVKQLATGMQMLEFDPVPGIEGGGMPVGLNLTKTSAETFTWLDKLVSYVQLISGVNATVRGAPEQNIQSGSMAALVVSQALTFTVGLQASYVEALEDCATGAIADYVDFGELRQTALIAGRGNSGYLKTFRGSDLSKITRVVVDVGNPLMKTIAGRMEVAQQMLANHLVNTPEQYMMVLTTGRLEPVIEGQQAELLCIKQENELLAQGVDVPVAITDLHRLHIKSHKTVVASPSARTSAPGGPPSAAMRATLGHIQEHISALKQADPDLLNMIGEPPLHPPPPPSPDSQAAYRAEVQTAAAGGKGSVDAARDVYRLAGPPQPTPGPAPAQAPQPGQPAAMGRKPGGPPEMPKMPRPPTNPLTHQPAQVAPAPAGAVPPGVKNR